MGRSVRQSDPVDDARAPLRDAVATLRAALPAWAADTARNVEVVLPAPAELTPAQHLGTVLVAAAALRAPALHPLRDAARAELPRAAAEAALAAASAMAGNAVIFRARHFLHGSYDDLRAGLRSSATIAPGWGRLDVELWCCAAAAVLGCQACLEEHEAGARAAGATRQQVHEALRVAAVVAAAATALDADA